MVLNKELVWKKRSHESLTGSFAILVVVVAMKKCHKNVIRADKFWTTMMGQKHVLATCHHGNSCYVK